MAARQAIARQHSHERIQALILEKTPVGQWFTVREAYAAVEIYAYNTIRTQLSVLAAKGKFNKDKRAIWTMYWRKA